MLMLKQYYKFYKKEKQDDVPWKKKELQLTSKQSQPENQQQISA